MSTNVKTNKTNKPILSDGAYAVLKAMQAQATLEGVKPTTVAELKAKGVKANSSHLTKLINEGFVIDMGFVKLVCACCGSSRKVKTYELNEFGAEYTQ